MRIKRGKEKWENWKCFTRESKLLLLYMYCIYRENRGCCLMRITWFPYIAGRTQSIVATQRHARSVYIYTNISMCVSVCVSTLLSAQYYISMVAPRRWLRWWWSLIIIIFENIIVFYECVHIYFFSVGVDKVIFSHWRRNEYFVTYAKGIVLWCV